MSNEEEVLKVMYPIRGNYPDISKIKETLLCCMSELEAKDKRIEELEAKLEWVSAQLSHFEKYYK